MTRSLRLAILFAVVFKLWVQDAEEDLSVVPQFIVAPLQAGFTEQAKVGLFSFAICI